MLATMTVSGPVSAIISWKSPGAYIGTVGCPSGSLRLHKAMRAGLLSQIATSSANCLWVSVMARVYIPLRLPTPTTA